MNNITLNKSNILGRKPIAVAFDILPLYKKAERNDLDAVFDLSRHFFSFEEETEHLQAALYYKSLLVENFPADYDPYTCAVTMTDIAHIFTCWKSRKRQKIGLSERTNMFLRTIRMKIGELCWRRLATSFL
ncbi:MAG: hypothetical protein H6573_32775 [Lewinellaceae bacterium]|nr:hypothetical protein [Lewinellaceae bacterium]